MKILLIDVNCKYSSTGKIVYDLYDGTRKNGHDAAICYGRGPLIKEPGIYKFGIDLETYIHAFLARVTGLNGFFSPLSTHRLLKFIKRYQPDVVHLHELHAYFVNIKPVIDYLKKNQIRTIWTFHCEYMYTGKCGQSNGCEKWRIECNHCPQLRDYPKSILFDLSRFMHRYKKRIFKDFNSLTIVTPSSWLKERVKASYLRNFPTQTIHNGIDTNVFHPRDVSLYKKRLNITNQKVFLAVAPNLMTEAKGGEWFLKLAKLLSNKNYLFIMVGVTNPKYISGYPNVISYKRTRNQEELALLYSLATATVLASKRETFSLVCAESLCCGTPVIGFDAGAPREIAPSGYGKFFSYGDINSLKVEIDKLGEVEKVSSNIEKFSEFGISHYSKEIMFRNYFQLYTRIQTESDNKMSTVKGI